MLENIAMHGAEAVIKMENGCIIKERVVKGYRIKQIDNALRRQRTKHEASLLRMAKRAGIYVPRVIEQSEFRIRMEYINGIKVRDAINAKNAEDIAKKIGVAAGVLHEYDIIHGDLTTSNIMLKDDKIFFIDFGLGFFSKRPEDKATDLFVLHEALESTHFDVKENAWKIILNAYKTVYKNSDKVIKALSKIENRRRYSTNV